MPAERAGRGRRYRPVGELSLFELVRLVGAGASAAQLEEVRRSLGGGFALERADGDGWAVAGWAGTEARAQEWVEVGGEPEAPSAPD